MIIRIIMVSRDDEIVTDEIATEVVVDDEEDEDEEDEVVLPMVITLHFQEMLTLQTISWLPRLPIVFL
jgi:hypothetical protein